MCCTLQLRHGERTGVWICFHLFVRMMDVYGRLRLVTPNTLVEGLQKGSLQQGQGSSHLTPTLLQYLVTMSLITEAQCTQLLYLAGQDEENY